MDDPLVPLLRENQITKTLTLVSKDSLYSYVFSIYDQYGNRFALKLIPIGKSEDSKIRQPGIRKNITPNSRLVEIEFNNLQTLSSKPIAIGPKPYFYKIYEYPLYKSVIGSLQAACKETKTITAVDEIKNLFDDLEHQGYQDIQLGCISMEYIPGQPLLEIITNIVKKYEKIHFDPKDQPDYQAVFINAISKIIFLFMEGYFLDDCHLGNIIIELKKRKREEEHDKREEASEALQFLSERSFDSRIIDLDRVYKRTQIYEDYESKEAFIYEVRNILSLQVHDVVALLDKKNELITKLLDSDNSISLKDITDIHDLRIILSLIRASSVRESSDEYAWLDQFLYSDDFLSNLLTYLDIMSRELEVHAGGKSKKSKTKKSKTKKSKTKKSKTKKKLKPNK